jgi:hypothetical protein
MLTGEAVKLKQLEDDLKKAKGEARNVIESQIRSIKLKFRIPIETETPKK